MHLVRHFLADTRGATAIEYGLIVAVLSLVIVVGVGGVGDAVQRHVLRPGPRPSAGASDQLSQPDSAAREPSSAISRAEPGLSGFCCEASGAQPDSQIIENVALIRPSGSE